MELLDRMRGEFEAWCKSEHHDISKHYRGSPRYLSGYTDFCWRAWQASRACLVVTLDMPVNNAFEPYDEGYNHALEDCRSAIKQAGIKTSR